MLVTFYLLPLYRFSKQPLNFKFMTPLNYTKLKELVIAFEELLQDEQLTEPEHELTEQIYGDMVNLQVIAEN